MNVDQDSRRVAALESYKLLDTPPEELFDALTRVASAVFDVPISLISLVDANRQWFKSRVGLDVAETPRQFAFCDHAIRDRGIFVINDAHNDPRFADNPLVLGDPNIRFYAGCPVFSPDGLGLGTLCIIDRKPRKISASEMATLQKLGRLASSIFESHRKLALMDLATKTMEDRQRQKELFAAMAVHDMRSPLTAILVTAASGQERCPPDMVEWLQDILGSAERLQRMMLDVLDISLAEHGHLTPRPAEIDLAQLVREEARSLVRVAHQGECQLRIQAEGPVSIAADSDLLVRIVTNLIDNAVRHARSGGTIDVAVRRTDDGAELTVADQGPGMTTQKQAPLFEALSRGAGAVELGVGYGLGLAFCKLAVDAHGGTIKAAPNQPTGTVFRVWLPQDGPPISPPAR